ncbi:MAG: beta-lactamase family protein [Lachnospiraceae bacterium]|nr:beta-lactamase family protein [Lachnospiraceae bacterium]
MDFSRVTDFLETQKDKGIAGCSCMIFKDDKKVYEHYTGYADLATKKPIDKDTLFRIYSMTKVIVCTAALQLYERGLYNLNDPLGMYMPEFEESRIFKTMPNGLVRVVPAEKQITVKDLFTMRAGLTYDDPSSRTGRAIIDMMKRMEEKYPCRTYTTREFAKEFASIPLAFEPGSHWHYSMCHDVLGAFIEVISGKTLGEYLKENIFEPLGMHDTAFHFGEDKLERLATMYTVKDGKLEPFNHPWDNYGLNSVYESGGAGLMSTLSDYMKFANTLTRGGTSVDGVRIIGRKTIDLMRTNHLSDEQLKDFDWFTQLGYGYGLGVRTLIDKAAGGVNSSYGEFGWSGMAGTWMAVDPEERLTAVYMQQRIPNLEDYTVARLRAAIYGCLD